MVTTCHHYQCTWLSSLWPPIAAGKSTPWAQGCAIPERLQPGPWIDGDWVAEWCIVHDGMVHGAYWRLFKANELLDFMQCWLKVVIMYIMHLNLPPCHVLSHQNPLSEPRKYLRERNCLVDNLLKLMIHNPHIGWQFLLRWILNSWIYQYWPLSTTLGDIPQPSTIVNCTMIYHSTVFLKGTPSKVIVGLLPIEMAIKGWDHM